MLYDRYKCVPSYKDKDVAKAVLNSTCHLLKAGGSIMTLPDFENSAHEEKEVSLVPH